MKKHQQHHPPRLAGWILAGLTVYEKLFTMTAEIEHEFQEIAAGKGYLRARAWYWEQILRSLGSYLSLSAGIGLNMFKNYLNSQSETSIGRKDFHSSTLSVWRRDSPAV